MKFKLTYLLFILFSIYSCNNKENGEIHTIKKDVFSGYVQKGPFIAGSSIMISELDGDMDQTGKIYSTRITNNLGMFEQKNLELISDYIELKADGFYFNEVTGKLSVSPISLYALTKIKDINSANVNILTHLEKSRVEYLVKNEHFTFEEAKNKALNEILGVFYFNKPDKLASEALNIIDDGMLLAISCIIQGHLSVAEMVELIANLEEDMRTDGKVDNQEIGIQLATNAYGLKLDRVRENMEKKHIELGIKNPVPEFESYIHNFLEKTVFEPVSPITYPSTGLYGINILDKDIKVIQFGTVDGKYVNYSMKADVPAGYSLKIIVRGLWIHHIPMENWHLLNESNGDDYNRNTMSEWHKEFMIIQDGKSGEACIEPSWPEFFGAEDFSLEPYYTSIEYYENGSVEPTFTKQIKIEYKQ